MLSKLRGDRGHPFCSTLQLSRSFKMLRASLKGGFSGTSFVWEKWLPQSHRGQAPALNRQGGNIRVAASYSDTFILHSENAPTNVALVARPCAPAAQRADESSSSRSRLAKSYGRFAPLSLKQDCFFRMPFSKMTISLPGPPTADNVMIFHLKASSSRLRSDSFQKFAPATQTLEFEKQSSLRSLSYNVAAVATTR